MISGKLDNGELLGKNNSKINTFFMFDILEKNMF